MARAMTNQDATATHPTHRFVPVAVAARILGLSATTVRRRIDAGELEAERVVRPQGTAFLVRVSRDEPSRADETPASPQDAPGARQDAPSGADTLTTVVLPLVGQIDALRQTVERQAEQIAGLREERGRLHAELDHLRVGVVSHGAQDATPAPDLTARGPDPGTEPSDPPRREDGGNPRSRTRWPWDNPLWLLLTGLLLIAMVTTTLWLD